MSFTTSQIHSFPAASGLAGDNIKKLIGESVDQDSVAGAVKY